MKAEKEKKRQTLLKKELGKGKEKAGERYKKDVLRCIVEGKRSGFRLSNKVFKALKSAAATPRAARLLLSGMRGAQLGQTSKNPPKIR